MQKIYKYTVMTGKNCLQVPRGARVLSAAEQRGTIVVWLLVTPTEPLEEFVVSVYATGEEITEYLGAYVATVLTDGGELVWHLFAQWV